MFVVFCSISFGWWVPVISSPHWHLFWLVAVASPRRCRLQKRERERERESDDDFQNMIAEILRVPCFTEDQWEQDSEARGARRQPDESDCWASLCRLLLLNQGLGCCASEARVCWLITRSRLVS